MKKKNGFTLVELLAVIVVLAIIMIIAIPSVLDVMNTARKKAFVMYVDKIVTAVQAQYVYDANGGAIQGAGFYVYDITSDLKLNSTGSYRGYVTVNATDVDNPEYIVELYDNNYMVHAYNVSKRGMPEANDPLVFPFKDESVAKTNYAACQAAAANPTPAVSCYTREGYLITVKD